MVDWYVDHGLQVLIDEVKRSHPGIVVGTIGDKKHQGEPSDHNPEPDGSVDAADFMLGPSFNASDAGKLAYALMLHRDHRIAYVIWDRHIMSSTVDPWVWRSYGGSDPHTGHVHVSVNDAHVNDKSTWDLSMGEKTPQYFTINDVQVPKLKEGDSDTDFSGYNIITRIQLLKRVKPDGVWGPITSKAIGAKEMTVALYNSIFGLA